MARNAGANVDIDAPMINVIPAPSTDAVKTITFGSFFWNAESSTTPIAMPVPRAVRSKPNPVAPEWSTSSANTGPSGTTMPPPMSPVPRAIITARTFAFRKMKCQPSLRSCTTDPMPIFSVSRGSRLGFVNGSVAIITAERKNVQTSTPIASVSRLTPRKPKPGSSLRPPATAVSIANTKLAMGNVP